MSRASVIFFVIFAFALGMQHVSAQSSTASANLPAFDAATIKPPDPGRGRIAGFLGEPGGRVFFGGTLKMLVECAFDLQRYQVDGGPEWVGSQWFEIHAVPPDSSSSREIKIRNANPSSDQRLMLQSLLRSRFGFKFHLDSKQGDVYILARGRKPLGFEPPKDPTADPRAIVTIWATGIFDGNAVGINTTTAYLAQRLSSYLQFPVVDETGITGSYDFRLPATDPENRDRLAAVVSVVDRLGLTIKRGRGPIQTLVIDHVEQPSEN